MSCSLRFVYFYQTYHVRYSLRNYAFYDYENIRMYRIYVLHIIYVECYFTNIKNSYASSIKECYSNKEETVHSVMRKILEQINKDKEKLYSTVVYE